MARFPPEGGNDDCNKKKEQLRDREREILRKTVGKAPGVETGHVSTPAIRLCRFFPRPVKSIDENLAANSFLLSANNKAIRRRSRQERERYANTVKRRCRTRLGESFSAEAWAFRTAMTQYAGGVFCCAEGLVRGRRESNEIGA